MAGLTERSLDRAINGLLQRDDSLCTKTIADDEEVDQLEKRIDKAGLEILLRYQPVASDLRQVVSAIKLSPNIERVADEATNIAECARKLNGHPPLAEVNLIVPIQAHAISMFKDGIDAFVREDVALARAVISRDKQLDDMNASANRQLTERMIQDRDQLRGYLNLIIISRCLERVGDHATNIAEVAFITAKTLSPSFRFIRSTEPVVIIDVTIPASVWMTTSDTTLSETIFSIVPGKRFRILMLIVVRP